MTSATLRCAAIRIYGSGKLCADPKSTVLSVYLSPMNVTRSQVLGPLKRLPASLFGASPDRFALRNLNALD